jgi:hypothetical protein
MIMGMGETGAANDFEAASQYISHSLPRMRAAALAATARLDIGRALPLLVEGLSDPSTKVRRAASASAMRAESTDIRPALQPVLKGPDQAAAKAALNVLVGIGSWEALRDILVAITSGEKELVSSGWKYLKTWVDRYHNHLFTRPPADVLSELSSLMASVRTLPEAEERREVQYAIGMLKMAHDR